MKTESSVPTNEHGLIKFSNEKNLPLKQVISLYSALEWSSAERPEDLIKALQNSHQVISAWDQEKLVGLGNSLSDGHMVVYYPHLLVHPDYQTRGIGKEIVKRMTERYSGFHQQILVADGKAIEFYKQCGFDNAGTCQPLWIYNGNDHD